MRAVFQPTSLTLSLVAAISLTACSTTPATLPSPTNSSTATLTKQSASTTPINKTPISTSEQLQQSIDSTRHEYTLDNGLKVIIKEDHRAPVVISQVWYRVGATDEPEHLGVFRTYLSI